MIPIRTGILKLMELVAELTSAFQSYRLNVELDNVPDTQRKIITT